MFTTILSLSHTCTHTHTRKTVLTVRLKNALQVGQGLNLGTVFVSLKVGAELLELAHQSLSVQDFGSTVVVAAGLSQALSGSIEQFSSRDGLLVLYKAERQVGCADGSNADVVGGMVSSTHFATPGCPDSRAEGHLEHTGALHNEGPGLTGGRGDDAAAFRGGVANSGILIGGASGGGVGVVGWVHAAAVVAAWAVGQDFVQDLIATGRAHSQFQGGRCMVRVAGGALAEVAGGAAAGAGLAWQVRPLMERGCGPCSICGRLEVAAQVGWPDAGDCTVKIIRVRGAAQLWNGGGLVCASAFALCN